MAHSRCHLPCSVRRLTHCAYVRGSDAIGSGEYRVLSAFSVLSIFYH